MFVLYMLYTKAKLFEQANNKTSDEFLDTRNDEKKTNYMAFIKVLVCENYNIQRHHCIRLW